MLVKFMMTEEELKYLIVEYFKEKMGTIAFDPENLKIEVKNIQGAKPEWVKAAFRASCEGTDH